MDDADARLALPPGTLLDGGRYRIERELGRGGFGITYLATDVSLGQRRALKEFFPFNAYRVGTTLSFSNGVYDIDRFVREAQHAATLRHLNVVGVQTVLRENGTAYIAMEYLDGASLDAYLEAYGHLPPDQAEQCLRSVLETLTYVHGRGIIHRDIKPSNIIAMQDGRFVLIDFGSARPSASQSTDVSRLVSGGYSPLEQYSGQPPTAASDLFSLAATIYHLVAGVAPPDALERAAGGINVAPLRSLVPGVRPQLSDAIDRALELHHQDRPQSAQAFLALLDDVRVPKVTKQSRKWPALLALGAIGVAALAGGFLVARRKNVDIDARKSGSTTAVAIAVDSSAGSTSATDPATTFATSTVQPSAAEVPVRVPARVQVPVPVPVPTPVPVPVPLPTPVPVPVPAPGPLPEPTQDFSGEDVSSESVSGDLGISGYRNSPPSCDGSYIALAGGVTTPGRYREGVTAKLSEFPDAAYFYVPGTCRSLRWQDETGSDIYAIFYGPYRSLSQACAAARNVSGYVKVLDDSSNPKRPVVC